MIKKTCSVQTTHESQEHRTNAVIPAEGTNAYLNLIFFATLVIHQLGQVEVEGKRSAGDATFVGTKQLADAERTC